MLQYVTIGLVLKRLLIRHQSITAAALRNGLMQVWHYCFAKEVLYHSVRLPLLTRHFINVDVL